VAPCKLCDTTTTAVADAAIGDIANVSVEQQADAYVFKSPIA